MKSFVLVACCVAFAALVPGAALAQSVPQAPAQRLSQRPPPPTEPSIPVPVAAMPANAPTATPRTLPVATPKPAVAKPVTRQKTVKRPGKGPTGPVPMPPTEKIVMMVRGTLVSINQANFTGNYSVLHDLTTPALQARVSEAQFDKAFATLRKQNLDLSPVLLLAPQFTAAPSVTEQGVLRLVGFFPSRPLQINFAIDYVPIDGVWLIDAVAVSTVKAPAQVASATAPESATASQRARMPWSDISALVFEPSLSSSLRPH